jgi:hypothetical protein
MKILSRDRTWGPALEERLKGTRYQNPHPFNGDWIFTPEPWEEVAQFAADICQTNALNLSPLEHPPCHAHRDAFGNDGSIKLRDRMVAAGVSIWHPDPLKALVVAGAQD